MTEPADRAVLLLQKVSELLLESRAIVKELEAVQDGESSADAADRIAYGILVAGLEEGLVKSLHFNGKTWTHTMARCSSAARSPIIGCLRGPRRDVSGCRTSSTR